MTTATVAEAFSALYLRHRPELERFVAGQVRDPELAAEIVQAAFTKAWAAWSAGHAPDQPRAWLYAVVRNTAVDELRARTRTLSSADDALFDRADGAVACNPEAALRDRELAELLWDAAADLSDADRALLDLQVRQGMDAEALAAFYGVQPGAMHTRLSRMRAVLSEAIAASLLVARGHRDCPALDAALAGARSPRQIATRHVRECPRCQAFTRPGAILAGLLPFPALARACERAWRARPRPVVVVRTVVLGVAVALAGAAHARDAEPPVALASTSRPVSASLPNASWPMSTPARVGRSATAALPRAGRASTSPAAGRSRPRAPRSRPATGHVRGERARAVVRGSGGRPTRIAKRPSSVPPSTAPSAPVVPAKPAASAGPAPPPPPQADPQPQPDPPGPPPATHEPEPEPTGQPQQPPPDEGDSSTVSGDDGPPSDEDPGHG